MTEQSPFTTLIDSVERLAVDKDPLPLFDEGMDDLTDSQYHYTTSLQALQAMSRTFESMLRLHPRRLTLIAGFQRLSRFAPYRERYERLAGKAKEVYVVGVPDEEIQPWAGNVHIMIQNAHRVERNWFEVLSGRFIHLTLVAEQTEEDQHDSGYRGFYTDSRAVCEKAHAILARLGLAGQGELF